VQFPGQPPAAQQPQQFRIDGNGQFVPFTPGSTSSFPQPGVPTQAVARPAVPQPGFAPSQSSSGLFTPQFSAGPPANNPIFQGAQNQVRQNLPGSQPVPPGGANPAINLINQLLTTPRQPPPGMNAPLQGGITPGAIGIAGVASTAKGASIKLYKERGKYSEWEFVFDLQQGLPGQPGAPGQAGQPGQLARPGAPGQASPAGGLPAAPLFPGPAAR
jgi:hypothetical protein